MISRVPARGRVWTAAVLGLLALSGLSLYSLQGSPQYAGPDDGGVQAAWTGGTFTLETTNDTASWRNGTVRLETTNSTIRLETTNGTILLDETNSTFYLVQTNGLFAYGTANGTFTLGPTTGTYAEDAANGTVYLSAPAGYITLETDDRLASQNRTTAGSGFTSSPMAAPAAGGIPLSPFLFLASSSFLALLVFARIRQDSLLKNVVRHRIHEFIKANPGKHYRAILKTLGLAMGVLTYHLNTLEKGGYITSRQDGAKRRFFPAGARAEMRFFLSELQERIVAAIQQSSGISQAGIAEALHVSRPLVNYHVHILQAAGLVRLEPRGRETGCYLVQSPPLTSPGG